MRRRLTGRRSSSWLLFCTASRALHSMWCASVRRCWPGAPRCQSTAPAPCGDSDSRECAVLPDDKAAARDLECAASASDSRANYGTPLLDTCAVASVTSQFLSGCAHMHELGVFHLDLKLEKW